MTVKNFDIDSLLDSTLDDLDDMPSFEPFRAGAHRVSITMEQKVVNEHPSIEVAMTLIETVELANPTTDTAQEAGSKDAILCMMDNEYGQGNFKNIARAIMAGVGIDPAMAGANRAALEAAQGLECMIVTSLRQDKNDKTVFRTQLKEIVVV